ncbi:hypothetical protein PoB_004956100 [Plakobranchus ocellatus]|uniref:Uncharacterized protein n=1 Tax=Plakobranchus ocellatus TaxID=259542 RepID=A0AAV4BVE8_9GAST|nr:hypothetical protein PoB_004956100 [Plakobranchus ocellatus]
MHLFRILGQSDRDIKSAVFPSYFVFDVSPEDICLHQLLGNRIIFVHIACPGERDFKLLGLQSGQDAGDGVQTHDRKVRDLPVSVLPPRS